MEKPREIAVQVLLERQKGEYIESLLDFALKKHALKSEDRGFLQELVYGVVRWQLTLDWLIAQKTGGKYYRADSSDTLRKIYEEIDKLERSEVETKKYVQVEELFKWAVIPGLLLLAAEVLLGNTLWRKLP